MKYYVESNHEAFEASYENGEGKLITNYTVNSNVEANSIDEAIKKYFEECLFWEYESEYADKDGDVLRYSVLVDENQNEVTKGSASYEAWKDNKLALWQNVIEVRVSKRAWEKLI